MRKPIFGAVVVTAIIAGALLATGPSNASACDTNAAAYVCITEPVLEGDTITGPILMVTVEDESAPIVTVDIYGPAIVTYTIPGPNTFIPPVIQVTTNGR